MLASGALCLGSQSRGGEGEMERMTGGVHASAAMEENNSGSASRRGAWAWATAGPNGCESMGAGMELGHLFGPLKVRGHREALGLGRGCCCCWASFPFLFLLLFQFLFYFLFLFSHYT